MDYTKKIFDLLQIEPVEVFKLKNKKNEIRPEEFYLSSDLILKYRNPFNKDSDWQNFYYLSIVDILQGTYTIVKEPIQFTNLEKIALTYAQKAGYCWVAKDKNNTVCAYFEKPLRTSTQWIAPAGSKVTIIDLPISFISWQDNEPFWIKDLEID